VHDSASSSPVRPGFFYACFGEAAMSAMSAKAANNFFWPTWAESIFATHKPCHAAANSVARGVLSPGAFLAT
jgi:hypothetical protein